MAKGAKMSQISKNDLVEVVGSCCASTKKLEGTVSNVVEMTVVTAACPDCGLIMTREPCAVIWVKCQAPGHDHMFDAPWPVKWLRKIEPPKQGVKAKRKEPVTT